MPYLEVEAGRIYYEVSGPEGAPAVIFSNSLGTDLAMWNAQAASLSRTRRVVRYDTRGHGRSTATAGPYSIAGLARDVLLLLDSLKISRTDFCGLSMGGMTGMWLAAHVPLRLGKVVLSNTAPKIGWAESWNARIDAVQRGGMRAVVEAVLERWYTPAFRSESPDAVEATRKTLLATPPEGYTACCAAIRDADLGEMISTIQSPTMVIVGTHDPVATPADARFMTERIPGSKYVELPAAHLSNIEAAEAFTMELYRFLMS